MGDIWISGGCDLATVRQWIDDEVNEIVPKENGLSLKIWKSYLLVLCEHLLLLQPINAAFSVAF